MSRLNNSPLTNGMSQVKKRFQRDDVRRKAVIIPLNGPQEGITSLRTTRTGQPVVPAAARACCNKVRPPATMSDLSRPMRVLRPPARIQTDHSGVAGFEGAGRG
jgi:hypothetical protein